MLENYRAKRVGFADKSRAASTVCGRRSAQNTLYLFLIKSRRGKLQKICKGFSGLELKRVGDVELANDTNIFVDRTFLSVIIFQDFIKSLENSWSNAGDYARNYYKNKIEKGTVIIPDLMVLVTCNNQDEYISRQAREISVDELRALDAYSFYNLSYHKALGVYSRQDRLLIVDNSGDKELATLVDEILFFINVQDELRPDIKKKMALEMIDAL